MPATHDTAKQYFGRPAAGLTIRDPAHGYTVVSSEPRAYPMSDYWVRRFGSGDMVEVTRPANISPAKVNKPASAKNAD